MADRLVAIKEIYGSDTIAIIARSDAIIIIIIHAFIKRRNPTCRSKALNNDVTKETCKANSNYVKIH